MRKSQNKRSRSKPVSRPAKQDSPEYELPSGPVSVMRKSNGRRPTLELMPEEIYTRMLGYIRAGAWDHVAASCMGVHPDTFTEWMNRGRDETQINKESPYSRFYRDVRRATAIARLTAEIEVKKTNPTTFLRVKHRSKVNEPGWDSEKIEHVIEGGENPIEVNGQMIVAGKVIPADETILEALGVMEELGLVQMTEAGKALALSFQKNKQVNEIQDEEILEEGE